MAKLKNPRQSRQYLQLSDAARKALFSSIESFNRVYGEYKFESTLLLLSNAWELLAKAILVKAKKNIYQDRKKQETISAEKAISLLLHNKVIPENHAELLLQVVSLRNRCAHNCLSSVPTEIQHHLLFYSCKFFVELMEKYFPKSPTPVRDDFLSLSFRSSTTYAAKALQLTSRLRKSSQGERELVWLLERGIRYVESGEFISQEKFEKLYKDKKKISPYLKLTKYIENSDMVRVVPVQAPHNYSADIELRKGSRKIAESLPVHYKKVVADDEYPLFSKDVAEKIGKPKNTNFVAAAAKDLGLLNNPEFHTRVRISPRQSVSRYNAAAVDSIQRKLKGEPDWNPMKKRRK